jgi:NDP-sugar pyrophosphorylase family protein
MEGRQHLPLLSHSGANDALLAKTSLNASFMVKSSQAKMKRQKVNATKVLILCGGRGRRLGKYTEQLPKPLIQVNSVPLLAHIVRKYQSMGFENFIFSVGYLGHKITEAVRKLKIKFEISDAGVNAGILQRIHVASSLMSETTLISYGDTFADINFSEFLDFHTANKSAITLVTAAIQNPFGIIQLDQESRITSFIEKPVLNHYIGYMAFNKKAFEVIPDYLTPFPDGQGLVKAFQVLSALNELSAYRYNGLQVTINTPAEYKAAQKTLGEYLTI